MLAGRPHEAVGNGSPRWMTAAPRKRGTEPGLQADSPLLYLARKAKSGPAETRESHGAVANLTREPLAAAPSGLCGRPGKAARSRASVQPPAPCQIRRSAVATPAPLRGQQRSASVKTSLTANRGYRFGLNLIMRVASACASPRIPAAHMRNRAEPCGHRHDSRDALAGRCRPPVRAQMAAKGRSPVSSPPTYGSGYLGLRGSGIAVADRLQRDGLNRAESEVAAALFRLCSGRRRAAAANDAN
jgi:hypothetical protein